MLLNLTKSSALLLLASLVNCVPTLKKDDDSANKTYTPISLSLTPVNASYIANSTLNYLNSHRPWNKTRPSKTAVKLQSLDSDTETIYNQATYYLINVFLGSNGQQVDVVLDTGSSDLWVPKTNVICTDVIDDCTQYGSFDYLKSTTYKSLNTPFSISYLDGSGSFGQWSTDDFSFTGGSTLIADFQFGLVDVDGSSTAVLGIAKVDQESSQTEYPNLPVRLAQAGYIAKESYSLYLGPSDGLSGNIIFGGIDTAKYTGSLVPQTITPGGDLTVNLASISAAGQPVSSYGVPVVLDSGTTYTYLLPSAFYYIGNVYNGIETVLGTDTFWVVNCDQAQDTFITYNFNGISIDVPVKDLLEQIGVNTCVLHIYLTTDTSILGDRFLRYAYLYYDLKDNYISLAKVKYTDETNIISA